MSYEGYECLKIRAEAGVVFATIDHPPINLLDLALIGELDRFGRELEEDGEAKVVVFDSADADFFIAHADVELILALPAEAPAKPTSLGPFHAMVDRFRTMDKVSIGKIEGVARGGGSEFLLSLDMRFGAIGKVRLAQPEVAVGIIPGGGGTQRLPRLMGRGRALEVILSCEDFSAELAEKYGYINRAFPAEDLGPFVNRLARRIASFPTEAIALAKASANAADLSVREGLLDEAHYFNQAVATTAARERMKGFLAMGGQTREVELNLDIHAGGNV